LSSTDSVTVSTVVAVDPVTAFSIFTEEIGTWWKPKVRHLFREDRTGTMRFEPGPGGRLLEVYAEAPGEPFEVGRILIWVPAKHLVFEWRQGTFAPNEVTQVEVRFEAVRGGTRVTIEHRGWDTLALDHRARHGFHGEAFANMVGLRWADLLTAFKARISRASTGTRSCE
jgi:hypothetical protein